MAKWKTPQIDLKELAHVRFNQGKTERELAKHFWRSKTIIHDLLKRMSPE
jgi:hypothetical protein